MSYRIRLATRAVLGAALLLVSVADVASAQPAPPKKSSDDSSTTGTPDQGKKSTDDSTEDNSAAPWYKRTGKDVGPPVAPKPPQLKFAPIDVLYDVHSFSGGTVTGAGSTLRLSATIPSTEPIFDAFLGVYLPNGALDVGVSFGRHSRYSFIPALMKSNDLSLYVASAHLDINFIGLGSVPFTGGLVGSPLGLRLTSCSTHLTLDARPTAGVWGAPAATSIAFSVGASISVGYYFSWAPDTEKPATPHEEKKPKNEDEDASITTQRCYL